jgi:hypothetical protein
MSAMEQYCNRRVLARGYQSDRLESTLTKRSVFSEADGQRINLMGNCRELRRPRTPRERSITGSPHPRAAAATAGL